MHGGESKLLRQGYNKIFIMRHIVIVRMSNGQKLQIQWNTVYAVSKSMIRSLINYLLIRRC